MRFGMKDQPSENFMPQLNHTTSDLVCRSKTELNIHLYPEEELK